MPKKPKLLRAADATLLDLFAVHAPPEIPDWFQPDLEPFEGPLKPELPPDASEQDRNTVSNWHSFGDFDLPEHLQWYQQAQQEHDLAVIDYQKELTRLRYFKWRWVYAECMLVMRDGWVEAMIEEPS